MIKYLIIIFCLLFFSEENTVSSKEQKKIGKVTGLEIQDLFLLKKVKLF